MDKLREPYRENICKEQTVDFPARQTQKDISC